MAQCWITINSTAWWRTLSYQVVFLQYYSNFKKIFPPIKKSECVRTVVLRKKRQFIWCVRVCKTFHIPGHHISLSWKGEYNYFISFAVCTLFLPVYLRKKILINIMFFFHRIYASCVTRMIRIGQDSVPCLNRITRGLEDDDDDDAVVADS